MREGQLKEYKLYNDTVTLSFDEEAHEYYYNDEIVPSTTKIIDEVLAKHALKFWAVKVTLEWIKTQIIPGTRMGVETIDAILKSAKFVHSRKSEEATTIGSNAHKWIERFVEIAMEELPFSGEKWPENWNERNGVRLETRDAINAANAFLNWYHENDVTFIYSERKVYSKAYNYSGTFDLFAIVNGVLSIIDFKTSKNIYPDYLVQGSGYWNAFQEELDFIERGKKNKTKVRQFIVLRLPKDGSRWETVTLEDHTAHFEIFRMARQMFDWIVKDINKINPKKQTSSLDTVQFLT